MGRRPECGRLSACTAIAQLVLILTLVGCQPAADQGRSATPAFPEAVDAVRALSLTPSQVLEISGPGAVRVTPGQLVGMPELTAINHGPTALTITFEYTLVRFDGLRWVPLPCQDGSSPGVTESVCGLASNQQPLGAGAMLPFIPGPLPQGLSPGWYALVYATLTEISDFPGFAATAGAALLLELHP